MTETRTKSLRKLDRVLSSFRSSLDAVIPIQVAHAFIIVAQNEGRGVMELAELAGSSKSTMSRHLLDLSDTLRTGQPGYGVLSRVQDPSNLRTILYTLSPKGKLLINQLLGILED